jgi:hypothetical protein
MTRLKETIVRMSHVNHTFGPDFSESEQRALLSPIGGEPRGLAVKSVLGN